MLLNLYDSAACCLWEEATNGGDTSLCSNYDRSAQLFENFEEKMEK